MTRKATLNPERHLRKNERIYYHYNDLEEFHAGMWKITRGEQRKKYTEMAGDLMRQPEEFKEAMRQASKEWIKSCESNLTAESVNRIAWLGHAGCCIATGSPEDCTRAAWHTLNPREQDEANRVAAEVLNEWLSEFRPSNIVDLFSYAQTTNRN